ncbi:HesA/MoeB/ThiF family protein [Arachidicoccus ginsenosidivorans]|uniref:HesA/MoeB/ThiF family protein n=1 Tax=Arachidicoccus ginsenosidivorans TaxID=496057 RepID=A0A5B8VG80_9BACT|nr:HesA/MoeB/ThiF family protein [Arachidicoccus ginsenosidivorans]QEC70607.1 HesA/MoeB/ThiF family protein [Arachidicoccus ginsenosidivorans]
MNTINNKGNHSQLTREDYMLYGRQMLVPEIGWEGQQQLARAKVMVIGAGGLGCPVLQYLNGAGVGHLGCVDFDQIEIHNLHRQLLYSPEDIAAYKVKIAEATLRKQRPATFFAFKNQRLTTENAVQLLQGYDLVVDGSDNFKTRYIVSDSCKKMEIPVIYGSILGFEGQMAVFGHQGGKTLRDLFASPPPAKMAPNCAENGVLATLPGIMGLLMAQEALKLLIGLPVLHNQLVLFNTLNWQWRTLRF